MTAEALKNGDMGCSAEKYGYGVISDGAWESGEDDKR